MKRYILLLAISVLAFASCSKEENTPDVQEKTGIAIDVICSKMSPITKAGKNGTKPGEDPYNENVIKTIDYFFFPEGKTDQAAVLHDRVTVPNVLNQYTVNVSIDEGMLNTTLFPRPTNTCQVAVLVNYPTTVSGNLTLAEIENLPLTGDFKENVIQSQFVMFGVQEVELISRKATLIANPVVDVHRVAAKITLDAHIAESTIMKVNLKDGGVDYTLNQTWVPLIDQMKIYLVNGVKNAVVNGDQEVTKPYDLFQYSERSFTGNLAFHDIKRDVYKPNPEDPDGPPVYDRTEIKSEQFHVSYPFYSYPQNWENGNPDEPYLKLVLPWAREAGNDGTGLPGHSWGTTQRSFYYRIMLPHDETGFVSNNWYHINLDVAILGADNDDASVDIDGQYYVVKWGYSEPVQADIKGSRYLSVSQLNHIMYNTTKLEIPYVTSNKCEIVNLKVQQFNFNKRNSSGAISPGYDDKTSEAESGSWVTLDDNNNIVINHDLNNDITTNTFDVAPYEYTFRIRHNDSGGATYYRDLKVLQYPAMYIEQAQSTGYVFVNGVTGTYNSDSGYIWDDNGNYGWQYRYLDYFLGIVNSREEVNGRGDNNNQYQYTVHVTVLPESSSSSIGDPRVETGTTLPGLSECTNYKPTAENTQDIIAPVFKIASSYGKTAQVAYEGGRKRCASYQENGYPAGRWRLPTVAEIEYLITLSQKNKIPTLFGRTAQVGYWAAGGYFYVANESRFINSADCTYTYNNNGVAVYRLGNTNYNVYTRCVYDVWYWGDGQDTDHLTSWGDFQTTEP